MKGRRWGGAEGRSCRGRLRWGPVPRTNSLCFSDPTLDPGRACDLFCVNSGEWKGVTSFPKDRTASCIQVHRPPRASFSCARKLPAASQGLGNTWMEAAVTANRTEPPKGTKAPGPLAAVCRAHGRRRCTYEHGSRVGCLPGAAGEFRPGRPDGRDADRVSQRVDGESHARS